MTALDARRGPTTSAVNSPAPSSAMETRELGRVHAKDWSGPALSVLFVLLYGTGFVIGKLGVVDAGPFSFLIMRFVASAGIFYAICLATRRELDLGAATILKVASAGGFSLFAFSGCAFTALDFGINPALLSVIVALQPILVAVLASARLDERIGLPAWIGFVAGFSGVYLIVSDRIFHDFTFTIAILFAFLAMVSLSLGNVFQKRHCQDIDIFVAGAIQNIVSAALCVPVIFLIEGFRLQPTAKTMIALTWMVVVVSVGAVSILYRLIKAQEVNRVTSLFFLTPIVAFFLSNALFGGDLSLKQIVGIAVVCTGVVLVNTRTPARAQA
jgi:drug/metabolite transporter (DMT)-like permease